MVTAILAVLTAIIMPVFLNAKREAKVASAKMNLKGMWQSLLIYQQDNDEKIEFGTVSDMGLPSPGIGFYNFLRAYARVEKFKWNEHRDLSPCGVTVNGEAIKGILYLGNGISDWPRDVKQFKSETVVLADKNCNAANVRIECQFCDKRSIGISLAGQIRDKRSAERHFYDQLFYQR